jgi:hypothetical protein
MKLAVATFERKKVRVLGMTEPKVRLCQLTKRKRTATGSGHWAESLNEKPLAAERRGA